MGQFERDKPSILERNIASALYNGVIALESNFAASDAGSMLNIGETRELYSREHSDGTDAISKLTCMGNNHYRYESSFTFPKRSYEARTTSVMRVDIGPYNYEAFLFERNKDLEDAPDLWERLEFESEKEAKDFIASLAA